MYELIQRGEYLLTEDTIALYVPSQPGVFVLSIRLVSGAQQAFFSGQSENLQRTLRECVLKDPTRFTEEVFEYLLRYQCYYSFFVVPEPVYRDEIEKMVRTTIDPFQKLLILNCN
ncbi:MAG TPA: hypothetical protein VLY03_01000 [Bacteroidota bacterium]|nr:hypothetical protein [Bacteroidota bacterium]